MSLGDAMDYVREQIDSYLPQGSLRRRLARGTFWSMLATAFSQLLGLIITIVIGNILGRQGFGEFGMIRSTVGMFGVFAELTLGLTANKFIAEYRPTDPAKTGRIIGMSTLAALASSGIVMIVLLVSAPYLAAHAMAAKTLPQPELLVILLQLGAVMVFFDGMSGAANGVLAGFEAFRTIARIALVQGLLNFPMMLVGVIVWGLPGAVGAAAVNSFVGWSLRFFAARAEARKAGVAVSYRGLGGEMPILVKFTLPALLSGVMVSPVLWAANTLLVNSSSGYAGLGLFNSANQWQMPILFLATQICAVLLPMLSSFTLDEQGERKRERVMEATFMITVIAVLPVLAILGCVAGWIISLYGPQFAEAVPIFSAVLFIGGARAIGNVGSTAIQSRGAMWTGFAINAFWGVLLLVLVGLWADNGPYAFANAMALSYFILCLVSLTVIGIRAYAPWPLLLRILLGTLAAAVIAYGPAFIDVFCYRIFAVPFALAAAAGVTVMMSKEYRQLAGEVLAWTLGKRRPLDGK